MKCLFVLVVLLWGLINPFKTEAQSSSDLFISEYLEGTSYNKALEIFNPDLIAINLDSFSVEKYVNGSVAPALVVDLPDVDLNSKDVFVICHPSADAAILSVCDLQTGNLNINGNDAVVLKNNGEIIDAIGQVGVDPTPPGYWGADQTTTQDHTLTRKCNISQGDGNASDIFDPVDEWDSYSVNTFINLGSHSLCLPTPSSTATPTLSPTPTLEPTIIPTQTPLPTPTSVYGDKKEEFYIRFENLALRFSDFFRNHEFKFWWNNKHLFFLR